MSKYNSQYYIDRDTDTYWIFESLKELERSFLHQPDGMYGGWFYVYHDERYGPCLRGSKTSPDNLIEITDNKKEMFLFNKSLQFSAVIFCREPFTHGV